MDFLVSDLVTRAEYAVRYRKYNAIILVGKKIALDDDLAANRDYYNNNMRLLKAIGNVINNNNNA